MQLHGHAIEARVNAEDASFFPSAGEVLLASYPRGVRVDAAVETGSVVGTDYDSMIAKVISHGRDRRTALARLDRALADTAILGLDTNVGFLRTLLARDDVRAGEMDTGLIGRLDPPVPPLTDEEVARAPWPRSASASAQRRPVGPPRRLAARRRAGPVLLEARGQRRRAARHRAARARPAPVRLRRRLARLRGLDLARDRGDASRTCTQAHADGELRAPMPGSVLLVPKAVGDEVKAGEAVVVLESMKMELSLVAPVDGTVTELSVAVGDKVARDQIVRGGRMTHQELVADLNARARAGAHGRWGEGPRAAHRRAGSCCRASAWTACWTRARRSWSSRRWPRTACTTATRPERGSSPASGGCRGASA